MGAFLNISLNFDIYTRASPNPQVDEFKFLWLVYISGFTQFSLFTHWVKVRFCLNWYYHRIQHCLQVPNLWFWGEPKPREDAKATAFTHEPLV
jgi:hypothetical protein